MRVLTLCLTFGLLTMVTAISESISTDKEPTVCGLNEAQRRDTLKIQFSNDNGNVDTKIKKYPWTVAILKWIGGGRTKRLKLRCGGSLISTKHVLTASHCVSRKIMEKLVVVLGAENPLDDDVTKQGQDRGVKGFIKHPKYVQSKVYYDVAIIELDKKIELSFEIHPICVPKEANENIANRVGVQAWVSGYGSKPEKKSTHIHYAKLAIMGQEDCENKHYGNLDTSDSEFTRNLRDKVQLILNSVRKIASEILCTRASIEEVGTCPGDSGSPLIIEDPDNDRNIQIGIVYGSLEECNDLNYPSLFARLDDYEVLKFIRANAFGDNIIAPANVKAKCFTAGRCLDTVILQESMDDINDCLNLCLETFDRHSQCYFNSFSKNESLCTLHSTCDNFDHSQLHFQASKDVCEPKSVDCVISQWSQCSTTCGPGIATRSIEIEGLYGGKQCPRKLKQICNERNCTESITTTTTPVTTTATTVITTATTITTTKGSEGTCESAFTTEMEWPTGATGSLQVTFPRSVSSWKIEITFSLPVTNLTSGDVSNVYCSENFCSFENTEWNAKQSPGNKVEITLMLAFSSLPTVEKVTLDGADLCSGSGTPEIENQRCRRRRRSSGVQDHLKAGGSLLVVPIVETDDLCKCKWKRTRRNRERCLKPTCYDEIRNPCGSCKDKRRCRHAVGARRRPAAPSRAGAI